MRAAQKKAALCGGGHLIQHFRAEVPRSIATVRPYIKAQFGAGMVRYRVRVMGVWLEASREQAAAMLANWQRGGV